MINIEVAKNAYSPGSPSWPGLYAFLATFYLCSRNLLACATITHTPSSPAR